MNRLFQFEYCTIWQPNTNLPFEYQTIFDVFHLHEKVAKLEKNPKEIIDVIINKLDYNNQNKFYNFSFFSLFLGEHLSNLSDWKRWDYTGNTANENADRDRKLIWNFPGR